ncbi:MAG TPA: YIP1 family protein [Planctomycetota bacterium]|nr:YIP1 family protein [Planctomycetota bacterium]
MAAGWRGALRAFSAAGATAFRLSTSPEAAFRSFRFEGPAAPPVLFVLAVGGPSLLLSVAWRALAAPHGEPALSPLAAAAIFALLPPLYVYVRAQILHLSLVLRGRAVRSFTATFRVVSYSSGAVSPLLLVPFAGEVLFLAAGVVIEATGLRACHRLGPIEAAILELLPAAIILLVLLATLPLGFFWWIHTRS